MLSMSADILDLDRKINIYTPYYLVIHVQTYKHTHHVTSTEGCIFLTCLYTFVYIHVTVYLYVCICVCVCHGVCVFVYIGVHDFCSSVSHIYPQTDYLMLTHFITTSHRN